MPPLLVSGIGASPRVSAHSLGFSTHTEGRQERCAAYQTPVDSVVVEGDIDTLCYEATRFLVVRDNPLTLLRRGPSVLGLTSSCPSLFCPPRADGISTAERFGFQRSILG